MDPRTLPPSQFGLYEAIKNQYQVAFEPLKIQGHQVQILKIQDLESLLKGQDPLKDVTNFPFWVRLWEAALVLAEFMATVPKEPGSTLLELGAGLGVPGLIAAAAGFRVTLTDYEELILNFERINAAASKLEEVEVTKLDWLNPADLGQYDVIIGAEILFRDVFFEPLLEILRRSLKEDGVIYLAHDSKRQSLQPFLKMAEKEYTISVSPRRLKSFEEDKSILLMRLKPRR
jgi:predicted nicotinamide N-methyase